MKCEWVQNNVTLYVYDELEDDARYEFERHLSGCADCAAEVESQREFMKFMSQRELPEPSASLLAGSRMRLQEFVEHEKPGHWWSRIPFDLAGWMNQTKLSPALSAVLVLSGFLGGTFTAYELARTTGEPGTQQGVPLQQASMIAGVRNIVQDPASKSVRIQYDTLTPRSVQGSIDDPAIQQLLLSAVSSNSYPYVNSGVRVDSIDLLAKKSDDSRIREALMYSLRYDKNPGVRLKALSGLQPYIATDLRVRDVVLDALLRDSSPGVRSQAIGMLSPVGADTSVRETLHRLANQDDDLSIKLQSRRILATLPDVQ